MILANIFILAILSVYSAAEQSTLKLDWVPLKAACFSMGEATGYQEERPARLECVEGFEIARTEITNAQFKVFVDATGYVTTAERERRLEESGQIYLVPAGSMIFKPSINSVISNMDWWVFEEGANWRQPFGPEDNASIPDAPVVHITRDDAEAFAKWAGGRLPTEAEWEYAARGGKEGRLLSWAEAEDIARTLKANFWQGLFPVLDQADDGFKGIAPVAAFPPNGFGLHDMIGNVWEWTSSPYSPSHSDQHRQMALPNGLDFAQPGLPVGTIKGGSFLCANNYCLRFRAAARQAQDLIMSTSHIGFRIARDSTP